MALQTYDYKSSISFIRNYLEEQKVAHTSILSEAYLYKWIQDLESILDTTMDDTIQIMISNTFKLSGIMVLKKKEPYKLEGFILARNERSIRDLLLSLPDKTEIILYYHDTWSKHIIKEFLFQIDSIQAPYICGVKKSHSTISNYDILRLNYKNGITIDSKKHAIVKELKEFNSLNGRIKNNKFVVEGSLLVKRALVDGQLVDKVIYNGESEQPEIKEILELCKKRNIPFYMMSSGIMSSITDTKPLPNILASVDISIKSEKDLVIPKEATLMILDGVKNPDNIGMILRTADASGVDAVVLLSNSTHFLSKNSIRAARGAVGRMAIYMCENDTAFFQQLHEHGFQIIGTSAKAKNDSFYKIAFKERVAFIVGNESYGIRDQVIKECNEFIKIPMAQGQSSLNVVVAASLILYESVRKYYTNLK